MENQVFTDINNTICLVTLLQSRVRAFQKELNFFVRQWPEVSQEQGTMGPELYLTGLRRLGHEVMFLTLDTYSLHEGISKNQSLISKSIKQNAALVSQYDKSSCTSEENFTHLGVYSSEGHREATQEEIKRQLDSSNKMAIKARRDHRDATGIQSKSHQAIDDWAGSLVNQEWVDQLKKLRDDFAHRFDSLEKISNFTSYFTSSGVENIISLNNNILEAYFKRLQDIISYTTSAHFDGMHSIYDSLARLKAVEQFRQTEKY